MRSVARVSFTPTDPGADYRNRIWMPTGEIPEDGADLPLPEPEITDPLSLAPQVVRLSDRSLPVGLGFLMVAVAFWAVWRCWRA